jgi:hypothetical protein
MNWDAADSFDGRYFGPLPRASIFGRAVPLWLADHTSSAPNVHRDSVPDEP